MSTWPPTCWILVYASMLSLKLVTLPVILRSAAILSSWAWYQWSLQVSQLNVPVGPGVAEAATDGATLGATDAAVDGATDGAELAATDGAVVAVAPAHAARNAPSPAVAPAAPTSLR